MPIWKSELHTSANTFWIYLYINQGIFFVPGMVKSSEKFPVTFIYKLKTGAKQIVKLLHENQAHQDQWNL